MGVCSLPVLTDMDLVPAPLSAALFPNVASGVRVHTPDRPDWAVAPDEGARLRRHSSAHPDWAVAPDDDAPAGSERGKGKGKKRRARRGRHSR